MMSTLSPDLARRLIAEAREDDARMTKAPWDWRFCDVVQLTDAGKGYPFDLYPDSQTVVTGKCEGCGDARGVVGESDALAIARTRNNLAAMADQLEAALAECERLTSENTMLDECNTKMLHDWSSDLTPLEKRATEAESALAASRAECERYKAALAKISGGDVAIECLADVIDELGRIVADRDRLAAELQAAKEENERLRRLVGEACDWAVGAGDKWRDHGLTRADEDRIAAIRREAGNEGNDK